MTCLAFLWMRNQQNLLAEMIASSMNCVIFKTACMGLDSKHLGLSLSEIAPHLENLRKKYGIHVCGEGGEYETITLDCPLFFKKIVMYVEF